IALGKSLAEMGVPSGLLPPPDFVAVKVPVFSFAKLRRIETMLGPEMKSTGEVLGIDRTYAGALWRGLIGAGIALPPPAGRILLSIADAEKDTGLGIARTFCDMDFQLFATPGTWQHLHAHGLSGQRVNKIAEGSPHVLDLISGGGVDLVINNVAATASAQSDGYRIRHAALEAGVACLTSLDTVQALLLAIEARPSTQLEVMSLQEYVRPRLAIA
ncbi:MAG: carbamoyl-phosphate synthase large subunit, partial [Candidatus Eremiobacteraeota bacterium]|nr:carbamoyl-phosphate synthase large subunit [Candidatus Eremiobacteraeota bacterium]